MRLTIVLALLAAVGCKRESPEDVLTQIAAAHEDYELERYYERSRYFLEKWPEHEARDRVRYEMAEQMAATALTDPKSKRAEEARALLREAANEARTKSARFDAALVLLKFTPDADPDAEARKVVTTFDGQDGLDQVYYWAITSLAQKGETKKASVWATELLEKFEKVEGRAVYESIALRGKLLGVKPPIDFEYDFSNKVVLIDFWATWCAPCVAAVPRIEKFYEKHHADGFDVIGVSLDEDDGMYERFTKKHRLVGTQRRTKGEGGLDEDFGVQQLPAYVIVVDGRIVELELSGEPLFERLSAIMAQRKR